MPWLELFQGAGMALAAVLAGTGVAALAGHRPPRGLAGAADVNARVDAERARRAAVYRVTARDPAPRMPPPPMIRKD